MLNQMPGMMFRAPAVTRQQHRHQVGLGAAAGKDPIRSGRQANTAQRPVDHLLLNQRAAGTLIPGINRAVYRRHNLLGHQRGQHDRAVQVRKVFRMVEPDSVTQIELTQLCQRVIVIAQRTIEIDIAELRRQFMWQNPAERLLYASNGARHQCQHLLSLLRPGRQLLIVKNSRFGSAGIGGWREVQCRLSG